MQEIPGPVRQLIASSIDSIVELEAILLLREHRQREWTVEEAGARLYVSPTVATYVLSILAERGFIVERARRYAYKPVSPELEHTVDLLASTYASQLIAVTHLIHAKPAASVLQFAKAFRLRKDS